MGDNWRFFFRLRCRFIADAEQTDTGFRVVLCKRWRWHGGPCRG